MTDEIERDIEVQEDEEVAAKTIVGGRPLKRRKVKMNIPAGIEKTIYKASTDPQFRARLFDDRLGTIAAYGFRLTDNERTMLTAIPDARLDHIIGLIRPEKHGQRKFMKAVATAVVTLATGTAVVACDESVKGVTADDTFTDTPMDIAEEDIVPLGITPDAPEDTPLDIEDDDVTPVDGIMPDAPPDVPLDIEDARDGDDADGDEDDVITDVGMESWGLTPDD